MITLKMADRERSDVNVVFYHEPLRSLIVKEGSITLRFDITLVSN